MKQLEKFFDYESKFDSKHILNTCKRIVPQEYLDKIENGCSLENLEEMMSKRFDIFKYKTQITIHGIFPELSTRRVGGYVNLTQNQNKSVGVRYNAIDFEKKERLFSMLKTLGLYHVEHNSTNYGIYDMKRVHDKSEYEIVVKEFDERAKKIDRSLFIGNVSCYLAAGMWGDIYIVLSVNIRCFYEKNFTALFENLSGMNFADGEKKVAEIIAEENRRREESRRKYEMEAAKRREEKANAKEKFLAENPLPEGFEKCESFDPNDGDIYVFVQEPYFGNELKYLYFVLSKYGNNFKSKPCDANGTPTGKRGTVIKGKIRCDFVKRASIPEVSFLSSPKSMTISVYSSTQIILTGETYPHRARIKELGGHWNKFKKGWTFDKSAESRVRSTFAL